MNNSAKKKPKKSWMAEGIIIAASPIAAYLLTYCYELGFTSNFGIPREFMTLELRGILPLTMVILFVSLSVELFIIFFKPFMTTMNVILRKIINVSLWIVFFSPLILLYLSRKNNVSLFFFFGFSLLAIYGEFISPLLTQKQRGSYLYKLKASAQTSKSALNSMNYFFGRKIAKLVLAIIIMGYAMIVTRTVGEYKAINQNEFMVIRSSPEMVVLRIYGDKLTCAPFIRTTKEVKRIFNVFKISEDSNLQLHLEKVGPLRSENIASQ
ncbi:MAG: hypothetical protein OEV55_04120 [candidate division Zixibacteria bacterium]|nr:hypothetical protein [candidate division Zixibacteria bacterium]